MQLGAVALLEASTFHASTTELTGPRSTGGPLSRPFPPKVLQPASSWIARVPHAHMLDKWIGRLAMLAVTALALHADVRWGILSEFWQGQGQGLVTMATQQAALGAQSPAASNSMADVSASSNLAASLASDITTLGDIFDTSGG